MTGGEIFCAGCQTKVQARLTNGREIYPHRHDLHGLPFWKCDVCGNYVGCHHKTRNKTKPLGVIPTEVLRNARKHIHLILDPLWKSGRFKRKEIYHMLTENLGWRYHTSKIRTIDEARKVYSFILRITDGEA